MEREGFHLIPGHHLELASTIRVHYEVHMIRAEAVVAIAPVITAFARITLGTGLAVSTVARRRAIFQSLDANRKLVHRESHDFSRIALLALLAVLSIHAILRGRTVFQRLQPGRQGSNEFIPLFELGLDDIAKL